MKLLKEQLSVKPNEVSNLSVNDQSQNESLQESFDFSLNSRNILFLSLISFVLIVIVVLICVCCHKKRKNKKPAKPKVESPKPQPEQQREEADAQSVHIELDDSPQQSVRLDTEQPIAIEPVTRKGAERPYRQGQPQKDQADNEAQLSSARKLLENRPARDLEEAKDQMGADIGVDPTDVYQEIQREHLSTIMEKRGEQDKSATVNQQLDKSEQREYRNLLDFVKEEEMKQLQRAENRIAPVEDNRKDQLAHKQIQDGFSDKRLPTDLLSHSESDPTLVHRVTWKIPQLQAVDLREPTLKVAGRENID